MEQEELLHFPAPVEQEEPEVQEDEDGNFVLKDPEPPMEDHRRGKFHQENLAERAIDEPTLARIAQDLWRAIEDDDESRDEWRADMAEGMELRGRKIEERSYPYQGAAGVYSNALEQSILTQSATLVSELLPPRGPAKGHVMGEENEQLAEYAEANGEMFNDYLTRVNKAFYPDFEQAVYNWIVPTGFCAFKSYKNPITNIPDVFHIDPEDFIVNTSATSLEMATRITHVLRLSYREMKLRQMNGMYVDIDITPAEYLDDDKSIIQYQQESMDGRKLSSYEFNKEYTLYECHVYLELEKYESGNMNNDNSNDIPKPYIVTIDKQSRKILSIYRNWEEEDPTFKRIEYFTTFTYIPGYGIYGVGMFHLASGNAKAATMAGRMLLDAGMLSNFPGGVRVKGMRIEDNNIRVGPTEFVEIETGGLPIQQALMPLPYREPSPILKELKDNLEDNIMKLAGASMTTLDSISPNMQVGTIMAIFESSNKAQSSITQRLHRSLGDLFEILYRIFKECIHEQPYDFSVQGKSYKVTKEYFHPNVKVIPVSDPNISSFPQRALTVETLLNTAKEFPDLHDMRAVLKRFYQVMKVQDIDEIMPKEEEDLQSIDPITENMNAMTGNPLKAFIFQDHASHKILHMSVLENPELDPAVAQALQAHIQEHTAFEYKIMIQQMIGVELPEDPSQLSPEEQNQIAMMAAQAVQQQQQEQAAQQPPPLTPEQVMMEEVKVNDKKIQLESEFNMRKLDIEEKRLEVERMKLIQKDHSDDKKLEVEEFKIETQAEIDEKKIALEHRKLESNISNEDKKLEATAYTSHLKHDAEMEKLEAQLKAQLNKPEKEKKEKND
jgi:hypothetical protein